MESTIQKYKSALDLLDSFLSSLSNLSDPQESISTFALIAAKMETLIKEIDSINYLVHPNSCPPEDPDLCNLNINASAPSVLTDQTDPRVGILDSI
jgi:hypothetical protein